uniref:Uncharacterized protein n=1 Tax=Romanomermis culicivorax TaxID=13658 RepID=A0A915HLN5_ROMCU
MEESHKVDCNHMHVPLFKINNTWSRSGQALGHTLSGASQALEHVIVSTQQANAMIHCGATYAIMDKKITDKIEDIEINPTTVVPIAANNLDVELVSSAFITVQAGTKGNPVNDTVRFHPRISAVHRTTSSNWSSKVKRVRHPQQLVGSIWRHCFSQHGVKTMREGCNQGRSP